VLHHLVSEWEEKCHTRAPPPPPRSLVSTRHDARAWRFTKLILEAELIFLLHRKTERLTESLTDASQLADSGRSRIVGYCNRLGRATWAWPMLPRVSPLRRLYKLLPGNTPHTTWNRSRVFATSRCLRCLRSLPHLERRRAQTNGRAGLQNHSPLRSCTREGELGFWEALCATAQAFHHGPSSIQVGRYCLPPSSSSSTSTGLLQHCHQQRYCYDYICKWTVRVVYCCFPVHHVLRVHISLLLISVRLVVQCI
jgi:hypothetical protein